MDSSDVCSPQMYVLQSCLLDGHGTHTVALSLTCPWAHLLLLLTGCSGWNLDLLVMSETADRPCYQHPVPLKLCSQSSKLPSVPDSGWSYTKETTLSWHLLPRTRRIGERFSQVLAWPNLTPCSEPALLTSCTSNPRLLISCSTVCHEGREVA